MAQSILFLLRRLNRWVAMVIGLVLLACVIFVLLDVGLRKLGTSFGGTDEVSGYVMAIVTSWGMGFALLELAHVRIDIVRGRAGAALRAVFDLFAMLVLSGTVSMIALRCWPVLERSLSNMSRANTPLETPLWLVQGPWVAGWVWFAITSWLTFLAASLLVMQGDFQQAEAAIGAFGEEEGVL